VIAVDRRGRGGSGDGPGYSLHREAEDVVAVVDSLGEPASVVGHSFGALCALEGALLASRISRLVLYEGVPMVGSESYPPGIVERLEAMLDEGEVETVLTAILSEVAGMTPKDVERLRNQTDRWQRRIANVRSAPREMREERDYSFNASRFRRMQVPTMLLVGGESPERELRNAQGVADALPHATVVVLPGQGHIAMHSAPELFTREVVRFLT
jgi:pimeloyl-ACP methyl ester carboxylesterase